MAECASADAIRNLLQLHSAAELHLLLKTEQWLAVADGIRCGRCNVRSLTLTLLSIEGQRRTQLNLSKHWLGRFDWIKI
jgi:hypothetical protein